MAKLMFKSGQFKNREISLISRGDVPICQLKRYLFQYFNKSDALP